MKVLGAGCVSLLKWADHCTHLLHLNKNIKCKFSNVAQTDTVGLKVNNFNSLVHVCRFVFSLYEEILLPDSLRQFYLWLFAIYTRLIVTDVLLLKPAVYFGKVPCYHVV